MKQLVIMIDEELHKKFKHYAIDTGKTMKEIMIHQIKEVVEPNGKKTAKDLQDMQANIS